MARTRTANISGELITNTLFVTSTGANVSNAVVKTGDTMTGQLNISSGGLLVSGNSNFDSGTLFIDSINDRVGIETINPRSSLDIWGLQTNSSATNANDPSGTLRLAFDGGANTGDYGSSIVFTQRWFTDSTTQVAVGQISGVKINNNGNFGGGLAFWTSNTTNNNLLERMRITDGGNVGIGTTNPIARFAVAGNLGASVGNGNSAIRLINTDSGNYASISAGIVGVTDEGMDFSTDGNRRMVIASGGNIGIATVSPTEKLHVEGSIRLNNTLNVDGAYASYNQNAYFSGGWKKYASGYARRIEFGVDGYYYSISNAAGGSAGDAISWTDLLRITDTGDVGIGTTSPSGKLHVAGSIVQTTAADATFSQDIRLSRSVRPTIYPTTANVGLQISSSGIGPLQFNHDGGFVGNILMAFAGGKVGIGTDPYSKLSINGSLSKRNGNIDLATHTHSAYWNLESSGYIEFTIGYSGSQGSGRVMTFTYEATEWKSWWCEIDMASTEGSAFWKLGGYNNNSNGHNVYETHDSNGMATVTYSSSGQYNVITLTFNRSHIHPGFRIKYHQSGGDGAPRMDRAKIVWS